MSLKQKKARELIKNFSPKIFGIKDIYIGEKDENKLEILFIIEKNNISSLMSYLNALSVIIEKELGGIEIESNVYVYDRKKDIKKVAKRNKLEKIDLIKDINLAGACAI